MKYNFDSNDVQDLSEVELIEMVRTTSGWTMSWTAGVYHVSIPNVGKFTCKAPANLPLFYEKVVRNRGNDRLPGGSQATRVPVSRQP